MIQDKDVLELMNGFGELDTLTYPEQEQDLGFLRDIFAAHAVRKEKAENELKAVQAEFESLKASAERQINQLKEQAQRDEADFQRRKADLERQIEAKRQQKAQEAQMAMARTSANTTSVATSADNTKPKDSGKGKTMLWVGLGLGAVALIGLGLFAFRKKPSTQEKQEK